MTKFLKRTAKSILRIISRIIFWITPEEFKLKKKSFGLEKILQENLQKETFKTFGQHIKRGLIFEDFWQLRKYAIESAMSNDTEKEYYYLEFGTWKGESANFFSKYIKKLYAFDSFQGLQEDWKGSRTKGTFDLQKKIPKLNANVEPVVGWVNDTLSIFLKKHNPKINFVHMDMDTYSPTKYTLEKLKPHLVKGAIIVFDELYNYYAWEDGEYKALKEVFDDNEYIYKAFTINNQKVVIQIK